LGANTIGSFNTAEGDEALSQNTTGIDETAIGVIALQNNTTGLYNTASGFQALQTNTTGDYDTGAGVNALWKNTTGRENTAIGFNVMLNNTTGSNNIGLGMNAGYYLTTGSDNIDIANHGAAAESNTIRIGTQGTQTAMYIAGIFDSSASGGAVEVSSTGKLGMVLSSARYKRDIHDMDTASSKLLKLRPVTFVYKQDPEGIKQYGLVAEEVARVYPELVIYGTDGKVVSIRYHELIPMLLNEAQKQAAQIKKLRAEVAEDKAQRASFQQKLSTKVAEEQAERVSFGQRLSTLERTLAVRDQNQTLAAAIGR